MKPLLVSYARYEYWANEKLLQVVLSLSEEQQHREIPSSFPSVYKTCLHTWDASSIWWQRIQGHTQVVIPSLSFHPSMHDVANGLLEQNRHWINWIEEQPELSLEKILAYKNLKGESFAQPVKDILLHLSAHGGYHRGQLVTLLRQLGVEKIPPTDYIVYARMMGL
ncbi:MAG TPA: DinB family protein [Sediminibacterium sp.]|nr:DinB family protein [Sediminibacterium sp.]